MGMPTSPMTVLTLALETPHIRAATARSATSPEQIGPFVSRTRLPPDAQNESEGSARLEASAPTTGWSC